MVCLINYGGKDIITEKCDCIKKDTCMGDCTGRQYFVKIGGLKEEIYFEIDGHKVPALNMMR